MTPLTYGRTHASLTVLPNGMLVLVGGAGESNLLTRVQMYNTRKLTSGKWKVLEFTDWTGSCKYSSARSLGVLPLSNTSVLVFGGEKYMNKPSRGTAVVDLARRRFVPREKLVVRGTRKIGSCCCIERR